MITYIDTHVHTCHSRDCFVTLREYLGHIREKGLPIQGIVITEHGSMSQEDYEGLGREYGILVFKGVEAYTSGGHMIAFGIEPERWESDYGLFRPYVDSQRWVESVHRLGGVVSVCHPFQRSREFYRLEHLRGVSLIEEKNGSNTPMENEKARQYAEKHGILCLGGSDAHYRDDIGRCLTRFDEEIASYEDFLRALRGGRFSALYLRELLDGKGPAVY